MIWIYGRVTLPTLDMDPSHQIHPHPISLAAIFFDGACQDGMMGWSGWIKLSHLEIFHIRWNGGRGKNNMVECWKYDAECCP